MAFNDYAFIFLLLSGMASRERLETVSDPATWMVVTVAGGTLMILSVLGIRQIVVVMETRRIRKAITAATMRNSATQHSQD